jgi:hypothetical protein
MFHKPSAPLKKSNLSLNKVPKKLNSVQREKALGVVLDAFQRVLAMPNTHDLVLVGPRDDLEAFRKRAGSDDETVVAGCLERVREAAIETFAIVVNHGCFAMHDPIGPHDLGAEGVTDALVAQADAKDGNLGGESVHDRVGDPGLARRAGTWGDNEMRRPFGRDLVEVDFVVARDENIETRVDLAQPLDEVVCEGIVIIDKDDHRGYNVRGS